MKFTDLIDFIYGTTPNTPRCRVCYRPLVLVDDGGEKYLFCKHCVDLAKEESDSVDANDRKGQERW